MSRLFGWMMLLGALYVGMQIYTQGIDNVYGGAFRHEPPPELQQDLDDLALPFYTPTAPGAERPAQDAPPRRVPITQRVRERVSDDVQRGAARRGY